MRLKSDHKHERDNLFQNAINASSFVTAKDTERQGDGEVFQSFIRNSCITTGEASFGKQPEACESEEDVGNSSTEMWKQKANHLD